MSEIIYAVRPAVNVEYIFGLFRFRIVIDKLEIICKTNKLVSFFMSVTWLILYVLLLYNFFIVSTNGNVDTAAVIVNKLPLILILFDYVIYVNITSLLHGEHNLRLFKGLSEIDHTLKIKHNKKVYKKTRMFFTTIAAALLVCDITYVIAATLTFVFSDFISELVLSIFGYFAKFELWYFCVMVHMVELRLKIVNNHLNNIVAENTLKNSEVSTIMLKRNQELYDPMMVNRVKLRDLVVIYDLIGETFSCVNKVFVFQIVMIIIINFSYMIISVWTLVYYFKKSKVTTTAGFITPLIVMNCIELSIICYVCRKILVTRKKTEVLVMKIIMDYNFPKELRRQAKSFLALLEAWPLRIMLYNMFSVDISLILKFISVSTTYLVIMLQVSHFL